MLKKRSVWMAALMVAASMVLAGTAWADGSTDVRKIVYYRLAGPVGETPAPENPFAMGGAVPMSLKDILEDLKKARLDQEVAAVVLDVEQSMLGFGQIEELRDALKQFAAVDKEVFVHADVLTTGSYALATAASHVSMTPTGDLWLTGLYGEGLYVKEMLDKLGLKADMMRVSPYKTAADMFTRSEPSEESEQMTNWLLDGLYASIVEMIADAREMTPDQVRALIDRGPFMAKDALEAGLVDSLKHRQDFVADVKKRYGENAKLVMNYGGDEAMDVPDNPFLAFTQLMEMLNPMPKQVEGPEIAVVYVEGMISTGQAQVTPFGTTSGAFSTTIRKALDTAAEDDNIKAVVLRVDSGGGSALASDIIWDAGRRVAEKKPFIASMGNVAGSGGYYVLCGADTIFADATTITGSIGVLSGKFVTTGGWNKLGVHWYPHKRGEHAGILSSYAPFDESERAKMEHYMDEVYSLFKQRVTDGRGDRLRKPLDEIAGGRVFTGTQALELGLIDRVGGLRDAVRFAGDQAGIGEYELRVLPQPPTLFDVLGGTAGRNDWASASTGLLQSPSVSALLETLRNVEPLRGAAVLRALQRIEMLNQEGVLTVMPNELLIH
jgi:protease-4